MIIQHRCAGHGAPENSLAGIRQAANLGIDGVEVDVRLTSDGVPVLMHDATGERTTDHCNAIAKTHSERATRWKLRDGYGTVPTLVQALDFAARLSLHVIIDLKDPNAITPVGQILSRYTRVVLWSSDATRLARLAGGRTSCVLHTGRASRSEVITLLGSPNASVDGLVVAHDVLDGGVVETAFLYTKALYTYLPPTFDQMPDWIDGLQAVVSDSPLDLHHRLAASDAPEAPGSDHYPQCRSAR